MLTSSRLIFAIVATLVIATTGCSSGSTVRANTLAFLERSVRTEKTIYIAVVIALTTIWLSVCLNGDADTIFAVGVCYVIVIASLPYHSRQMQDAAREASPKPLYPGAPRQTAGSLIRTFCSLASVAHFLPRLGLLSRHPGVNRKLAAAAFGGMLPLSI
jgi:hypothetical protein